VSNRCLRRGRDRLLYVSQVVTSDTSMAMKNTTPLVSTLNPNAPLFVPAAFRAVEDFSPEWWNLVQTSPAFRDQWLREKFPGSEEQDIFAEDLEELADLDEFLEYQEQLQEMEAVQESLYFDIDDDFYVEDESNLVNINNCRDLKSPKQQVPQWCKPLKHHDKIPSKVGGVPKKGAAYRIQQPRHVM